MKRAIVLASCVTALAVASVIMTAFRGQQDTRSEKAAEALEACHTMLRDMDDYPLVFLGEEFEGLPLVWCHRKQTSGTSYGIPPTDQVIFVYGTCTPTGGDEASCLPPLQVHVYPPCQELAFDPGTTRTTSIRWTDTFILTNGNPYVLTSTYHAKISAGRGGRAIHAVGGLRGANALAAPITAAADLGVLDEDGALPCGEAGSRPGRTPPRMR